LDCTPHSGAASQEEVFFDPLFSKKSGDFASKKQHLFPGDAGQLLQDALRGAGIRHLPPAGLRRLPGNIFLKLTKSLYSFTDFVIIKYLSPSPMNLRLA